MYNTGNEPHLYKKNVQLNFDSLLLYVRMYLYTIEMYKYILIGNNQNTLLYKVVIKQLQDIQKEFKL